MTTVVSTYIDGVDLAETIATAINATVKQAVAEVLVAKASDDRANEAGFDIRAQILANAAVLWPILAYRIPMPEVRCPGETPAMSVVITGIVSSLQGCRGEVLVSRRGEEAKYIFVVGRAASSPEQALRGLLEDTMAGLMQERERMGTMNSYGGVRSRGG